MANISKPEFIMIAYKNGKPLHGTIDYGRGIFLTPSGTKYPLEDLEWAGKEPEVNPEPLPDEPDPIKPQVAKIERKSKQYREILHKVRELYPNVCHVNRLFLKDGTTFAVEWTDTKGYRKNSVMELADEIIFII